MRKAPSAFCFAIAACFLFSTAGPRAYGQERDEHNGSKEHPNGIVKDWSNRHVAFTLRGPLHSLIAVQNDARAQASWQSAFRFDWHRSHPPLHRKLGGIHPDWSIPLTPGSTAVNVIADAMYPAKFGFDPTAAPSCPNDYVVFPVNAAASSTQPNIVGFNNLYSGTAGATGICNAGQPGITRTSGADDDGVSATTMFSYAIAAAGGVVATSPALSTDGTKIAFVETGSGTTAHFHVLAWKSGDGVAANLQTTTSPKQITSGFATSEPTAGQVTDLTLTPVSGTASDTFSSPFVDYAHDFAYIGNDSGTLFRVKNVFCPNGCGGVAPSLDSTWGTSGALATGCTKALTGPVVDPGTGHVLVGCADGKLYGFTTTGTIAAITGSPLTVGDGTAAGGIADPALIDVINGFAYVATMSSSSGHTPVLVQTGTANFSTVVATAMGSTASTFPMHAPAFNNDYFTGVTADAGIFDYTSSTTGTSIAIWEVGFNAAYQMNSEATEGPSSTFFGSVELSPMTEFFNPNTSTDWLFASALAGGAGNLVNYDLSLLADTFGDAPTDFGPVSYGSGTSGIIVDNDSSGGQAASVYFGAFGTGETDANSAVKATQSLLE